MSETLIKQILSRRSIRKFKNESVREEVLNNILEAGRCAPTATNIQPWHFIIARSKKAKEACTYMGFNTFANEASFVILGLYKQSEVVMDPFPLMDVTVALQNMVIAAWVQGVGSCWMGAFDERKLREVLKLPEDARIVGGIACGIPDESPSQPVKKALSEIVHYDEW